MRPKVEDFNQMMERLFPANGMVRTVTVQVTDACNLCCTYCYQINKKNHIIDLETAKKYLIMVLEGNNPYINLENTGGFVLDLIGGEPFIAIDLITELCDWLMEYMIKHHHPWLTRFRISLCSNGTLYFNPKVQDFLRRYGQLISMTFSIDGNKELHDACRIFPDGSGSYDMAVAAAKHWASHFNGGAMPSTKLTLAPSNVQYFSDAHINLIQNLGYTSIFCNCCFEEGWKPEHAGILYREMNKLTDWLFEHDLANSVYISMYEPDVGIEVTDDKNWCGGTGEMISVDWKGDIYPCIRYMESSLGTDAPPLIIGNVNDGIATKPEWVKCIDCLKCITRSSQSPAKCMTCPVSNLCAWCSGYNYQHFGTANKRATYICQMHQARVLGNLYFWKKFHDKYPDDQEQGCLINNLPKEWALEFITEDEWNALNDMLAK